MLTRPHLYEAKAANILPLLQDAPVIISRRVAHSPTSYAHNFYSYIDRSDHTEWK